MPIKHNIIIFRVLAILDESKHIKTEVYAVK